MKRLSEEYGADELGGRVLREGQEPLAVERENTLRTRVLQSIALSTVTLSSTSAAQAAAPSVSTGLIAKVGALKLLTVLTIGAGIAGAIRYSGNDTVTSPETEYNDTQLAVASEIGENGEGEANVREYMQSQTATRHRSLTKTIVGPTAVERNVTLKEEQRANFRTRQVSKEKEKAWAEPKGKNTLVQEASNEEKETASGEPEGENSLVQEASNEEIEKASAEPEGENSLVEEARVVRIIRSMLDRGDPGSALGEARRYRSRFKEGALRQDVEFLFLRAIAQVAPRRLKSQQARFFEQFPQSPYRDKINKLGQ